MRLIFNVQIFFVILLELDFFFLGTIDPQAVETTNKDIIGNEKL